MRYLFLLGRNRKLSLAEMFSYLEKQNISIKSYINKEDILIFDLDKEIKSNEIITELGGIIAIGRVLCKGNIKEVLNYINNEDIYLGEKIKFTYSILNFSDENSLDKTTASVKNKFKQEKLKARYKSTEKTPKKIKLTDVNYFLFNDKDYFFGIFEGIYDPKEIEKRDMEKPIRREELAISPKLAKILINLSQTKKGEILLDPFCGIGVILQEALLQDINVIGVDINKNAINDAKKNLIWFENNYNVNAKYDLINEDSRKVKIGKVDGIATEPSLGILLKKTPNKKQASLMIIKFENLMIDVLNNIKKYIKKNGKIAFTAPVIKTGQGNVVSDIDKICKKTDLKLHIMKNIEFPIKEFREGQVVGREFYVLIE